MPLLSLPEIENKIAQILELITKHEQLARAAGVNENILSDLASGSEMNTRNFMKIFQQLKTLFTFFVTLYLTGRLQPIPLASLMLHFRHNLEAETQNAQSYQAILALKKRHGTEHHRHVVTLSDLELHHIVLLPVKHELRLCEQGVRDPPLPDIDLNV
jgi:hypothetical protein